MSECESCGGIQLSLTVQFYAVTLCQIGATWNESLQFEALAHLGFNPYKYEGSAGSLESLA